MRQDLLIFGFVTFLAITFAVVFSHHGLLDLRRFRVQIDLTRSRIAQVEDKNRRLKQEVTLLKENPEPLIERQIRENLGWVRPNELVYIERRR